MWHKVLTRRTAIALKRADWSQCVFPRGFSTKEFPVSESETKVVELLRNAANCNEFQDPSWPTSPYPQGVVIPGKDEKIKEDPSTTSVLVFPGQGTVKIGAIKDYLHFPRVKEIFDIANEILGYDVFKILERGPKEKLNRTEFNQVATVTMSLAAIERLWEERPRAVENCHAVAGYSVGEIAALIFSGVIGIEDGIRLAAIRGAAMQAASDSAPQGMLSVYCKAGCKIAEALDSAKKYAMDLGVSEPVCSIAIYLHPGTKILAGHEEALQYIEKNSINLGFRHLRKLPLSGAFHTELMRPATSAVKKALDKMEIDTPRVTVYSNAKGRPYSGAEDVRRHFLKQMYRPVKWEQIMHEMFSRSDGVQFPRCFDMGSRGIMKGIIGKVNAKAADTCFIV